MSLPENNRQKQSPIFYAFPILLGLIGSLIGWAIVRDKDPVLAKRLWYVGIGLTLPYIIFMMVAGIGMSL